MVTVRVRTSDLDDRREGSAVQFFSPFFASSSFPAHGTLGARAESGDQGLGDVLDDFDIPAIAGGTVGALSGAIHLLCRCAFGRVSVSREEMACSPVPGRTHGRDATQLDGHASLRSVLGRPDPGRHHDRDTAQRDSQASLLTVLQSPDPGRIQDRGSSPVPGRIQDRDARQLDSHDSLLAVLHRPAEDGGGSPLSGRTQIAGLLQSAALRPAAGPPIGGGATDAQEAARAQEAGRIVQSHARRIIARRRFVHLMMARERAIYARRLKRVTCAQSAYSRLCALCSHKQRARRVVTALTSWQLRSPYRRTCDASEHVGDSLHC